MVWLWGAIACGETTGGNNEKGDGGKQRETTTSLLVPGRSPDKTAGRVIKRVSMGWWHLRLSAKILALLRLSVNFFSVTVNERVKN